MAVILIGPPGAGKTTVGPLLARALSTTSADSDAVFTERYGDVTTFFSEHGEPAFRTAEARLVLELLDSGVGVLSLGGGAPLSEAVAEHLRRPEHTVVLLDLSEDAAVQRIGTGAGRPLLSQGLDSWRSLAEQRAPRYRALADVVCSTDTLGAEAVRDRVLAALQEAGPERPAPAGATVDIHVGGAAPYEVVLGRGTIAGIREAIPDTVQKVLVISQPAQKTRAERVRRLLSPDLEVVLHEIPDAEDGKRLEVAAGCWEELGQRAFSRTDLVVGLGGGAATDLAGFVAATWLRGIRVLQIPTTVLAMADAAVGGKTGINTAEGKNLVGSFHTPVAVLCDTETFETLPEEESRTGFAEVLKCGFLGAPGILEEMRRDPATAQDPSTAAFHRCLESAIRLKADVVTADLRESGRREFLNYGHTLGHAIEFVEGYRWRHGRGVAVGMIYAARLAAALGLLSEAEVAEHERLVTALGLPVRYRGGIWPELYAEMLRDKKTRNGVLRFVLLDGIGHPLVQPVPDVSLLQKVYEGMSE